MAGHLGSAICGVRHLHPRHCKDEEYCVETEARRDRGEESGEAEAEPVTRDEPASDICRKASCIGARGCGAASETLRDEEQGETEPEADVGWPDQTQIEAATRTPAGRAMLPVPRTALPRRLRTQMQTAPPIATFA